VLFSEICPDGRVLGMCVQEITPIAQRSGDNRMTPYRWFLACRIWNREGDAKNQFVAI